MNTIKFSDTLKCNEDTYIKYKKTYFEMHYKYSEIELNILYFNGIVKIIEDYTYSPDKSLTYIAVFHGKYKNKLKTIDLLIYNDIFNDFSCIYNLNSNESEEIEIFYNKKFFQLFNLCFERE